MNKKKVCIVLVIFILLTGILTLWINGTIPKQEESYRIEYGSGIASIDDLYNHSVSSNYKHIKSLPKDYSVEQAQKDNCFINIGIRDYNGNLYNEFMDKYNKKEDAFIRTISTTVEGDIGIFDLLYEAKNNKIHLVTDNTRDKFSTEKNRTINYKTYEKTGIWNYENSQYWVVYNGELPNGTNGEAEINSGNLFIIATILNSKDYVPASPNYEFIGEIIEVNENFVIVKPDSNSVEIKSSDKIMVNIIRPTNGTNDFYVVGNKIKITYNGNIMETYPAQINASKIELVS